MTHDDDGFRGLCPDHERGYIQIADGHRRRIVREFRYEPREWVELDADIVGIADGLYCSICFTQALKSAEFPSPYPAEVARAEIRGLALERPLRQHDHRSDIQDLAVSIADSVVTRVVDEGTTPEYDGVPDGLTPSVAEALRRSFANGLYRHQAAAIAHAIAGRDVIQTTTTASGKTIGFLTPVIDRLVRSPGSRAIVMAPLNVLSPQLLTTIGTFGDLTEIGIGLHELRIGDRCITVALLNGEHADKRVRASIPVAADLVITNHHMVHDHLLCGGADRWGRFLAAVDVVVIDEIDRNRGGDGAEQRGVVTALLHAIGHHSGRRPQLLTASATVSNPIDVHTNFGGRADVEVVNGDTGLRHDRTIAVVDATDPDTDLHDIVAGLIADMHEARPTAPPATLVFSRSKDGSEHLVRTIRHELAARHLPSSASATLAYHGEVTGDERRGIEGKLRTGQVRTVVSTSALEAGADIDQLSVCILAGMPDTAGEVRQRIGRAGRKGPALVVLVADDSPMGRAVLGADDPRSVIGVLADHVVVTDSTPTDLRVVIDPLVSHFGRIPAELVSALPEPLVAAAIDSGRHEMIAGDIVPLGAPSKPERLASGSEKVEVVGFGGKPLRKLSGARAARVGFVGAELAIRGSIHQVIKVGFRRLEVKPVAEPLGVTATSRTIVGEIDPVWRVTAAGMRIDLGVADMKLAVFPSIRSTSRIRHSWDDAGIATVHVPKGWTADELGKALREHAWRVGVGLFDVEVRANDVGRVEIIDLDRAGRMSWHLAERLGDIIDHRHRPARAA